MTLKGIVGSLRREMFLDAIVFDILLRGGAITTLMVCASIFFLRNKRNRKDISVIALCAGLIAYLLVSSPNLIWGSREAHIILSAVAAIVPVLVYWASLELFEDEVDFRWWQAILATAVIVTAWISQALYPLGVIRGMCVVILLLHLLFVIATGDANDLVEERRRFRRWFLSCVVLLGLIITAIESAQLEEALPEWVFAFHALSFWILSGVFVVWATTTRSTLWITSQRSRQPMREHSPAQVALIGRIEAAMDEGLWRQEGLTVKDMAEHLETQEHRLRSTINKGIGHRNFAGFINDYRIAEAQKMLRDTKRLESTILSIAFDVGFASLGPFNRAFRARTGMTPTQYRRESVM